jgi:hypothetical protein
MAERHREGERAERCESLSEVCRLLRMQHSRQAHVRRVSEDILARLEPRVVDRHKQHKPFFARDAVFLWALFGEIRLLPWPVFRQGLEGGEHTQQSERPIQDAGLCSPPVSSPLTPPSALCERPAHTPTSACGHSRQLHLPETMEATKVGVGIQDVHD